MIKARDACSPRAIRVSQTPVVHLRTPERTRHDQDNFYLLRSVPGIGKVLAMTILYEIHDIARFPRVQDFSSYARLIRPGKESAGKRTGGGGGAKIGNAPGARGRTPARASMSVWCRVFLRPSRNPSQSCGPAPWPPSLSFQNLTTGRCMRPGARSLSLDVRGPYEC